MSEPIRLGDASDFVEIKVLERGTLQGRNDGDLRLGVSVRSGTFSGSYEQVWVGRDEWSAFVAALARLELQRSGQASLRSMSPDEFELHIRVVDRAGHPVAHGFLSRHQYGHTSQGLMQSRVAFAVEIDSSTL